MGFFYDAQLPTGELLLAFYIAGGIMARNKNKNVALILAPDKYCLVCHCCALPNPFAQRKLGNKLHLPPLFLSYGVESNRWLNGTQWWV